MGKRKIHGVTYYQCDYTGLPMRNSYCYVPSWKEDGRMTKQGSYCCWEAVLAATAASPHAAEIKKYVEELVGCELSQAPPTTELAWLNETGRITTIDSFLCACEIPFKPVHVVEIDVDGRLTHAVLARRAWNGFAHRFTTTRKKGKEKTFEVCFLGEGPANPTATQYFKQALFGPIYVALKSNELAIQERTRYLDLNLDLFSSVFLPRKRKEPGLEKKEYESVKEEMQQELMQVEAAASAAALPPSQLAKAAVMPCASGAEIALLYPPPLVPPLPGRQLAVRVH
jgi:hypothetical protein